MWFSWFSIWRKIDFVIMEFYIPDRLKATPMVLTIITEKNREASYLEQLVNHGSSSSSRASSAHLINLCLLCLDLA